MWNNSHVEKLPSTPTAQGLHGLLLIKDLWLELGTLGVHDLGYMKKSVYFYQTPIDIYYFLNLWMRNTNHNCVNSAWEFLTSRNSFYYITFAAILKGYSLPNDSFQRQHWIYMNTLIKKHTFNNVTISQYFYICISIKSCICYTS